MFSFKTNLSILCLALKDGGRTLTARKLYVLTKHHNNIMTAVTALSLCNNVYIHGTFIPDYQPWPADQQKGRILSAWLRRQRCLTAALQGYLRRRARANTVVVFVVAPHDEEEDETFWAAQRERERAEHG